MALGRVKATPFGQIGADVNLALTFATLPAVGNAIVVLAGTSAATATCADNQGNTYTQAGLQANGSQTAIIFVCAKVATAAGTFTVTVHTSGLSNIVGSAVEVSGVGNGLVVDKTTGASGNSLAPATGATAALTASESFQAATWISPQTQTSIAVNASSPVWTEEWEGLSSAMKGEGDSRIVTSAAGTTPSVSWTPSASGFWVAVIVAFGASAPSGGGGVPGWLFSGGSMVQSYNVWNAITPSDTLDLGKVTDAVLVGGAGDVNAVMQNGQAVALKGMPAGAWLPLNIRRVNATGTTATNLVALYQN